MSPERDGRRGVFRVGITGHRPNKLPPGSREAVSLALGRTLARLDAAAAGSIAGARGSSSGRSLPEFHLVSPLAEGVDRMAVQAAPPGWVLDAVLPMPLRDYEQDFLPAGGAGSASLEEFRALLGRAASVVELPALGGEHAGTGEARNQQYAMLGTYLVGRSDLLVAVWDGRPAEGAGGTATVVAEALRRAVAIVWIDPRRPDHPAFLRGFEGEDFAKPRLVEFDDVTIMSLLGTVLGRVRDTSV